MTFESLTLMPFRFEKSSVRKGIFNVKATFSEQFMLKSGKNARIMIKHVCFMALSFAGSLGRCLNTRPDGLVFKQLPQEPANVNA